MKIPHTLESKSLARSNMSYMPNSLNNQDLCLFVGIEI